MKQLVKILICVSVFQYATAQKYIEKTIESSAQTIEIYLDVVDNLILESAKIDKLIVRLNNLEGDFNNINIVNKKGRIIIRTDNPLPIQDQINKFCVDQPTTASYKIIVPQGRKVSVNINQGNLTVKHFIGDLKIEIETGFVELNTIKGDVILSIIDGSVVAKLERAEIKAHSNLGKVVNNLPLKGMKNTSNTFEGTYKNNQQKLIIKAIKANIYLEMVKD